MPAMTSPVTPYKPPANGSAVDADGRGDWPIQATDAITRVVDTVRDKTTGPALNASRWLTYGLVLALLALPVSVLLVVGLFRITEGGLLWVHGRWAWAAFLHDPIGFVYLLYGLICSLAALICWHKGKAPAAD
jgi:hypothetical protein